MVRGILSPSSDPLTIINCPGRQFFATLGAFTHDLLFDRLHLAVLGAFLDDRTDFRLGDLALGPLQAQQAGDARRASGEQPHEGRRRDRKQPHRPRDDFCGPLGGVHADAFGNQFAEDDREVGDRDDDSDLRRDGRRAQRNAQSGQLSAEFRR